MKNRRKCEHVVETQAQVAEKLGVSVRTVEGWTRRGMPGQRGAWDLAAIGIWLWQRARDHYGDGDGLLTWPLRVKRAQALRLEAAVVARTEHDRLIREAREERDQWFERILAMQIVVLPGLLCNKSIDAVRAELQLRRDEIMATGYGIRQA